jgi:hypothetical protein
MKNETRDAGFDEFCEELEQLKGNVPLYKTSPEWLQKVLAKLPTIDLQL